MRIVLAILFMTCFCKAGSCNLHALTGLPTPERATEQRVKDAITLPRNFFYHDSICYRIVSEEKRTCEVSNDGITDESGKPVNRLYKGKIEIPSHAVREGKRYTVIRVGDSAFDGCAVTEVHLPATVTDIGRKAFFGTRRLMRIDLPHRLSHIGQMAFAGSGLELLVLPASVELIEAGAFALCESLCTISCLAEEPPKMDASVFHRQTPLHAVEFHVPYGSRHLYEKAEGWKSFTIIGTNSTRE